MTADIRPLTLPLLDDLERLLGSCPSAHHCGCMWFLTSVREFHAAGAMGNAAALRERAAASPTPLGLLAFDDASPVAWCAAGPRSRFSRAIRTPTYRGRDPERDDAIWLIACFFVREDRRRTGLTHRLVEAAVALARESGAEAVEGFPYAKGARPRRDLQVGLQATFDAHGFRVVRQPSKQRVIVRRDLTAPFES